MKWQVDMKATRAVADLFKDFAPTVRKNGGQYLVEPSPYGQMELIPLRKGLFLVAAESPPAQTPDVDLALLPRELVRHLSRNRLRPWKLVRGGEASEVLRNLVRGGESSDADDVQAAWSPYTCDIAERGTLVGQARLRVAEHLAAVISAQGDDGPVAALAGPRGVGKRTLTVAAAGMLGLSPIELPLQRLFVERILQTPLELFLDTVLAATAVMGDDELLVVNDAEVVARFAPRHRRQMLVELSRLPNVVLLLNSDDLAAMRMADIVTLSCPGLADVEEARELLEASSPGLTLEGPALEMVCRASSMGRLGIIPARLLHLVRLGQLLVDPREPSPSGSFSPDEAAPAIEMARQAWDSDEINGPAWHEP